MGLREELAVDPLTRGYVNMTDEQVATSLNTVNRSKARKIIPAHEIVAALVGSEVAALSATERQILQIVISAGSVDIRGALIKALFPVGSVTRVAILALASEPVSRAAELELSFVKPGHVKDAR